MDGLTKTAIRVALGIEGLVAPDCAEHPDVRNLVRSLRADIRRRDEEAMRNAGNERSPAQLRPIVNG